MSESNGIYWLYWHSDERHLACETVTMAETSGF